MRKSLILLLLLVLILVFSLEIIEKISQRKLILTKGQEPAIVTVVKPKFPERVGEKIIYDVMLGNIKIGKAIFHYQSKLDLNLKPANLFAFETRLMRFKDNEKIYSAPGTFLPLRVEREIFAWPKYEKITEVYDQGKFTLDIVKTESGREQKLVFKKDSAIHNAILLPYLIRQIPDLALGWSFQANLPTQQFKIELVGIDQIKVVAGTFKAYHFKSAPERFEIWISDDEYRIPLKIKGMSGIGYTLEMREYILGAEK